MLRRGRSTHPWLLCLGFLSGCADSGDRCAQGTYELVEAERIESTCEEDRENALFAEAEGYFLTEPVRFCEGEDCGATKGAGAEGGFVVNWTLLDAGVVGELDIAPADCRVRYVLTYRRTGDCP